MYLEDKKIKIFSKQTCTIRYNNEFLCAADDQLRGFSYFNFCTYYDDNIYSFRMRRVSRKNNNSYDLHRLAVNVRISIYFHI